MADLSQHQTVASWRESGSSSCRFVGLSVKWAFSDFKAEIEGDTEQYVSGEARVSNMLHIEPFQFEPVRWAKITAPKKFETKEAYRTIERAVKI